MNEERKSAARAAAERLKQVFGYCDDCARDTASSLVRWRYAELVN